MHSAKLIRIVLVSSISFLLAGACLAPGTRQYAESPGMYDLTGWNYWTGDINGEVGHRLYVKGPTARCVPSQKWSGQADIISGSLPSGLSMDSGFNISGIPTDRGHWIVQFKLSNVECQGQYYKGFEQELRFHISGTGRVVQ